MDSTIFAKGLAVFGVVSIAISRKLLGVGFTETFVTRRSSAETAMLFLSIAISSIIPSLPSCDPNSLLSIKIRLAILLFVCVCLLRLSDSSMSQIYFVIFFCYFAIMPLNASPWLRIFHYGVLYFAWAIFPKESLILICLGIAYQYFLTITTLQLTPADFFINTRSY